MVTNEINPNTPIQLIDTHTKAVLKVGTYDKIRSFRKAANKKDLKYGAVRFTVEILWDN